MTIDFGFPCYSRDKGEMLTIFFQPNCIFSGVGTPLMEALVNRSLKCMKLLIMASIFLDFVSSTTVVWIFCLLKPSVPILF